jgi:hypothetical protein
VEYVFDTGCSSEIVADVSSSTILSVASACAPSAGVSLIAHAHDVGGNDIAWSYIKSAPMSPDTAPTALAPWTQNLESYTMQIDDVPSNSTSGGASVSAVVNGISLNEWGDSLDFSKGEFIVGGAAPPGFADSVEFLTVLNFPPLDFGATSLSPVSVELMRSSNAGPLTRTSAAEMLPEVTAFDLDFATPGRPEIDFSLGGSASGDLGLAGLYWSDASGNDFGWKICFPPEDRSFQIPELPAFLSNVIPPSSVDGYSGGEVGLVDYDFVPGYKNVRNDYPYGGLEDVYYFPADDFRVRVSLSNDPGF